MARYLLVLNVYCCSQEGLEMKNCKLGIASLFLVLSANTNAAIITHGSLSSHNDGSSNIITDSLNNVEWLRFDVLPQLTYAETLSILDTQDGGGWQVANQLYAESFVNSLLQDNSNQCAAITRTTLCGTIDNWTDGDFGDNTWAVDYDYVWFLMSDTEAGYLKFNDNTDTVTMRTDWGTITESDIYSGGDSTDIAWLMFRDINTTVVPVPAAVWLFSSGLLALLAIGRKRNQF